VGDPIQLRSNRRACVAGSIAAVERSYARLDLNATRFEERHEGMRLVDRVRGTRLCNEKLAQEREGSCGL
jgi:hypothetical protein